MTEALLNQQVSFPLQGGDYNFIRFSECYLNISEDGNADIMATLKALKGAEKVSVIIYLQRYDGDWTTIKKWKTNQKGSYLTFYESVKVQKGIGYRIQVYSYADKGAFSECLVSEYGKVF